MIHTRGEGGRIRFGRLAWQAFPMVLDEIVVFDRVLTPDEIRNYVTGVRALAAAGWPTWGPRPRSPALVRFSLHSACR